MVCAIPQAQAQAGLQAATDEQKDVAREAYRAGRTAFDAGDFSGALEQFRASYDHVNSPNSLLMVGSCQRQLGQLVAARRTFLETRALAVSSDEERYAAAGEAAGQQAAELDAELGSVQVNIEGPSDGATLTVGDEQIPTDEWDAPIVVNPGVLRVTLSDGNNTEERTVEVAAGATTDVYIGLPERLPSDGDSDEDSVSMEVNGKPLDTMMLAYVAAGVGAAGLLTFVIAGAMSSSKFSDLEDNCDAQMRCEPGLEDTANSGETLQTVANIGLVIGVLGGVAAVTLYVLTPEENGTSVALTPAGVQVMGRF